MRDVAIMATHLNHQTILAIWQNQIPDKRLRNGPPPRCHAVEATEDRSAARRRRRPHGRLCGPARGRHGAGARRS